MYAITTKDSSKVTHILKQGRVVAFPTGTSYGLAADALQGFALQRVRNLKRRPAEKSLTVYMAERLWGRYLRLSDTEQNLLQAAAQQPLTLLVAPRPNLAHLAQEGRVGLRVIDHPLMAELAHAAAVPLTATSANRAGEAPCFSVTCVLQAFPGKLPDDLLNEENPAGAHGTTYDLSLGAILDGGALPQQPPTTIAKIIADQIHILRQGSLTQADLQAML